MVETTSLVKGKRRKIEIPEQGKSFGDLFPDVASEFVMDMEPNKRNLTPWDLKPYSHDKVMFRCKKCDHVWVTSILNRTSCNKTGCPKCQKSGTSYQEQYVKNILKCVFPDLRDQVPMPRSRMSFDMFIPSINLVIEYGQSFTHDNRKSDEVKRRFCQENKINILFIIQDVDVKYNKQYYKNGEFRIPNRNKTHARKFIDPVIDKICEAYGKQQELSMVDRNWCSAMALADSRDKT